MPDRETSSLIHDSSIIFGRNKETEMVIRTICNKDIGKYDNGEILVYGIWGMGGVGKTTLAQLVYNHERVRKHFDLKCWVYVSQRFQVKEIIKGVIESLDGRGCTLTRLETLQNSLQTKLSGKKFLIVLDDVWIEDDEKSKWDVLSSTLKCGAEGSFVVMTTRSQTTSQMMARVPELQHELGCLSEEDSWLLFKKLAFAEGREGGDISELEPIGREIAEKCKRLPLAVKTLGSLMWSKSSTNDRLRVKDSNIWEVQGNNVFPALKLSYDNLSPYLKRCFAYCCLFTKGQVMEKDILISLWVSNGFIPQRGGKDLYMYGEEILNCLVWKSFFQVVSNDREYKMHDLMHDMARHVMGDDCLPIEHVGKEVKIPNEVLHLSLLSSDFVFAPMELRYLRSTLVFIEIDESSISQIFNQVHLRVLHLHRLRMLPKSICKLKHLRYLYLSHSYIEVLPESIIYLQNLQVLTLGYCARLHRLPESIGKLKHLRFLNLTHSDIQLLPESIIYLQNLQGLLLDYCLVLYKLPDGLRYMSSLRCLDTNRCFLLRHFPIGINELTSLRLLPVFPIGEENGAKICELGDLNLLEGTLQILGLENVGGLSEAKSASLKSKTKLSALSLNWFKRGGSKRKIEPKDFVIDEEVLEGLEPNPCLKELTIQGYMGKVISPSWMVNSRSLVETKIFSCENCEHISALGRLPNLRVIWLVQMASLKSFHDDVTNMLEGTTNMFLCLQILRIHNCPSLVSLPSNLPRLKYLSIEGCTELVSLPDEIQSFKDLNVLRIQDCKLLSERCEKDKGVYWPNISHIPNISIYP